jgi:Phage integrase family
MTESPVATLAGFPTIAPGPVQAITSIGMDRWAWEQLRPWLHLRATLPVGALFCVLRGPTAGRAWAPAGARSQLHHAAARAGVRRRVAPHQLRHAHAVEMSREGVPLLVIQRQLGHADLAITSVYLRGIDNTEIVQAIHERPAPMIPATPGLWNPAAEPGGSPAYDPPAQHVPFLGCRLGRFDQRNVAEVIVRLRVRRTRKQSSRSRSGRPEVPGDRAQVRPRLGRCPIAISCRVRAGRRPPWSRWPFRPA